MALNLADRVRETTTVTGTGPATLLGAVTGYQSFSVIGNGNTTYYTIADQGGPNWEVGLGTWSTGGTLARTTVLSSSNGGSLVNFTTGTKDVFVTYPSEKAVYLDGSGNITPSSVGPLTVSSLTDSGLTAGRVNYNGTGGLLVDSANMTFSGTALTLANDASISGLTVGKGGGALASNTAFGVSALTSDTSGIANTALGWNAVALNTTGSYNTGIGYQAGYLNTTGYQNTSVGVQSLYSNQTGLQNTAVGYLSLYNNTVSNNSAFGYIALNGNTTGTNNTGLGFAAAYQNTTGACNTAVGSYALALNTTASNNTAVGFQAIYSNQTGQYNTGIGQGALYSNTADFNTAVGRTALFSNTSGSLNAALGVSALNANTTGSSNSAFGYQALVSNTTASNNTAVGYQAGYSGTTATSCAFFGTQAGYNVTGSQNTCLGTYAGGQTGTALSGTYNTFVGYNAGAQITSGGKNVILGSFNGNNGGLDIRTASNYIVLSDGDGNPRGIFDNSGNLLVGTTSSSAPSSGLVSVPSSGAYLTIGHANGTATGQQYQLYYYNSTLIGSVSQNGTTGVLYNLTSDYRLKNNPTALTGASEFIMSLKPKTWDWWDGSGKGVGFIAHEFMEVAKYSGNGTKDEVDAEGKPIYQSIQPSSSEVMANLVSLVQELKAEVDSLKQQLGK